MWDSQPSGSVTPKPCHQGAWNFRTPRKRLTGAKQELGIIYCCCCCDRLPVRSSLGKEGRHCLKLYSYYGGEGLVAEHDTAGHFVSSARNGHSTPLLVFRWSETPPPNPWKGAAHVEHGSPHLSQPISRKSLAELNPDAWVIPGSVSLAGNNSNRLMTHLLWSRGGNVSCRK